MFDPQCPICDVPKPRQSESSSAALGVSHIGLRGFTLIEVLAAMVFIGIVIPVAMRCVSLCSQSTIHARHLLEASELAQQKISEILVENDTSLFNGSGDFNPDFPEYSWQVESTNFDSGDMDLSQIYQVTVHIHWFERNTERSYDLSTLVYPTTESTTSTVTAGATP